ncbi:uncharacterized protein N7498_006786 [Penicillium cinerascens]|uniref:Transketolase-like pyrimidine-binding domain-containing protein n=1 Tax=Penicillium cinerascens TaxID=70096 RepID=A0A9W9MIW3_9EURO|nr:uncharacterized protein N7498_006786 [Penicillium cinerascens]KAJ5202123.1 hypothetical protein N7498_006786 [Penicillium cinerascens]
MSRSQDLPSADCGSLSRIQRWPSGINGPAAYAPNTIIHVTYSFTFYLYAAPAVRMAALQQLQIIHVATHDSIGNGEDGPTHQSIELAAFEEAAGAWIIAISAKKTPSIVSTSRQGVPQLANTRRDGVAFRAYVISENEAAFVTLIGAGPSYPLLWRLLRS